MTVLAHPQGRKRAKFGSKRLGTEKKSRLDGNRRPFPLCPAGKRPRSPMPRITGIEIRRHVTDREKHNRARNMPVCGKRTTQSSSRRRCHRNEI